MGCADKTARGNNELVESAHARSPLLRLGCLHHPRQVAAPRSQDADRCVRVPEAEHFHAQPLTTEHVERAEMSCWRKSRGLLLDKALR